MDFNGQVAVVTGAGAGLGRAYALLLGARGAHVVVNDLGGSRSGEGQSSSAADKVVEEIKRNGGIAVADYNSVVDGEKIIKTALENFGRVDIVINNAGILRDRSFARISDNDWNMIQDVHVKGAFKVTQAAWPHFCKQKYGRVIFTSSTSGLFGNFGQANYSSAKMALIGLCNTLAIEGAKFNIKCNVIVPYAASRLTQDVLPPDLFEELKPELIAPVVAWLCHENCEDSGSVIESGAGWATKYYLMKGNGGLLRRKLENSVSIEDVRNNWENITSMNNLQRVSSAQEAIGALVEHLDQLRTTGTSSQAVKEVEPLMFQFDSKACILYALGIGATVDNESDLKYLYEGHESFSPFPTFSVLPGVIATATSDFIPEMGFDVSQIRHGEQYLEVIKPLPSSGSLTTEMHHVDTLDKGKGAVVIVEGKTYNEAGESVAFWQSSIYVVGGGGFGGKRDSDKAIPTQNPPKSAPDYSITQKTSRDQAALYRLSGDLNPLHIDPSFSQLGGFKKPILHGLCSLGFSARHVLSRYGNNDPSVFKAIKVRFAKPMLPGDTIKTEMWEDGNRIYFQSLCIETQDIIISGAYIDLHKVHSHSISSQPESITECKSDGLFLAMQSQLKANRDATKNLNGTVLYKITKGGKHVTSWTLDLKGGKLYKGQPEGGKKEDTTMTIEDEDMISLASGRLNPQVAFMKGKLKIQGNISLAQKLRSLMTVYSKL